MQLITIIGNLTHSPETKDLDSGMLCSFTVAVNSVVRQEKVATFYRVSAFGKLADVCSRYLNKGAKVAVIGDLSARLYDGRDGEKRLSLDVKASEVEFLNTRSEAAEQSSGSGTDGFTDVDADDLPF